MARRPQAEPAVEREFGRGGVTLNAENYLDHLRENRIACQFELLGGQSRM